MSSVQLTNPQTVRARPRARGTRAARPIPEAPWTPADRVVAAGFVVVGVLLILAAWLGASDTTNWDTQLSWTAVAMAGVVVVCLGVGVWLFRGFARVRAEARAVRHELSARIARRTTTPGEVVISSSPVTVSGMAHHHSPGCLLVVGKQTVVADEATLAPCGVCS